MKPARSYRRVFKNFVNRYTILMVWAIGNVAVFACTFVKYKNEPQYYYLRQMLGYGLCISRSSGTTINFSCALILLPMCRSVMAITRRLNRKVSLSLFHNVADHSKAVHVSCAYTLVVAAVIHTAAHMVNACNFSSHFSSEYPDLNLAEFSGQNPFIALLPTVPGITGILMIIILLIIVFTSMKFVRYKYYNLFWYSHHLMFLFVILLLLHPIGGILKEQVNLEVHPPADCLPRRGVRINVTSSSCSTRPTFLPQKSHTWKWMALPLMIYALDFAMRRLVRTWEPATVVSVRHLCGSVMRLTLRRRNLFRRPRPGQFVLLNCPSVSSFEWHPFSVSLCGLGSDFSVHIRIRGDWSSKLSDQLKKMEHTDACTLSALSQFNVPKLYVDGPFCSPLEDVILGPISICIAGGIGITPFASVLYAFLAGDVNEFVTLRRLHLIWSCRDGRMFTLFADLLCALHFKLWNLNRPDLFQIQLCLTSRRKIQHIKAILGERHGLLISRLEIGRPDWRQLFMEWINAYEGKQINVFSCGPASLSRQIKTFCSSLNGRKGTSIRYQHESFS